MSITHIPPEYKADAFNCPHCRAYAEHLWNGVQVYHERAGSRVLPFVLIGQCRRCGEWTVWFNEKMIFPEMVAVDPPNSDLNESIKADYQEAAGILEQSPRGAAALLRLAIQKVCVQLGKSGDNLNEDIAALVKDGLPAQVQQSLDIVRVIGNNAVHPGKIDLKDDRPTALRLFNLVNLIAQVMITDPKQVAEFYISLPSDEREKIEKRNAKAVGDSLAKS